jgi:hypothetical protein
MLPAADLSEILANLSALNLQPNTAVQILAAVLAPLLRSSGPDVPVPAIQRRPRSKLRRATRQKRKKGGPRVAAAAAGEPTDGPRARAIAALKANPDATLTAVAKIAGVGRSTVVNARGDLAAAARKQARRDARKPPETPAERRQRAQQFLRDELARGPKQVSDVEVAAAKAHIELQLLAQARGDLGVVVSRGNAGGVQAVQWSLPG